MTLRIERIPTFGDNYTYLAICDETNHAAIIARIGETDAAALGGITISW